MYANSKLYCQYIANGTLKQVTEPHVVKKVHFFMVGTPHT